MYRREEDIQLTVVELLVRERRATSLVLRPIDRRLPVNMEASRHTHTKKKSTVKDIHTLYWKHHGTFVCTYTFNLHQLMNVSDFSFMSYQHKSALMNDIILTKANTSLIN